MSLKYRDHNGVSRIISGITPGGNMETGAVATRSGTYSIGAVAAGATGYTAIQFSEPMPDADYEVIFDSNASALNFVTAGSKTANGFTLHWINVANNATGVATVDWYAYKLYEVADAEQLYSTVQDIEAMIPSSASSTNKFATASDLRTESRALDRRLDDVEDCIPSSADISNQLVTQSDLDNVTIEELGEIQDVDVSGVTDGQTIIWDDANQKWVNGQGGKVYSAGDGISISNTDEISAKVDGTSITTDSNDALKVADSYKTAFVGTKAEWDALTTEQKKAYKIAHITDDVIGGEVADEVTNGLMSPVTSNAVYDRFAKIKFGTIGVASSASSGTSSVTFDVPFANAPVVVASFWTPSANTSYVTEASVIIMDTTTTGFSFKWKCDSSTTMSKAVKWIAMA